MSDRKRRIKAASKSIFTNCKLQFSAHEIKSIHFASDTMNEMREQNEREKK